jgi:hypothetical protein
VFVIVLNDIMLSVIVLRVVAPSARFKKNELNFFLPGGESFKAIEEKLFLPPLLLLLFPPLAGQGQLPATLPANVWNLGTLRYL